MARVTFLKNFVLPNDFIDMSKANILSAMHPERQTNLDIIRQYNPNFKSNIKY